jgi:DNA-3-methyladenine glycosylase
MSELRPLPRAFYGPSAREVARRILGHWLIRNTPDGPCGGPIVEAEAYLVGDPACHGAPGLTARNRVMFGPPGHAYVYLIYGLHHCVNAVCRPAGVAEALLVRAIEPALGQERMRAARPGAAGNGLTNGPAKVCEALRIGRELDGADLCEASSPLYIGENPGVRGFRAARGGVVVTTRVGITRGAERLLRFYLEGSPSVSRREPNGQAPAAECR